MSPTRLISVIALACLLVVVLSGCGTDGPEFVAKGHTYDLNSALELPDSLEVGELAKAPTADAVELRHDALVALRKKSAIAAEAADIITATFPAGTSAVPFYVERAMYDAKPAIVMVEAIGPKGGSLSDRRLWVISLEGDVLLSGTR